MTGPDPRVGLRDLTGDYTHLHNRCHQREAALVGLLREARDLIFYLGSAVDDDLLRRIDAATTDNAREGTDA